MPSIARAYVEVAKIAEKEKLTYEDYLARLVEGELLEKHTVRVKKFLKDSKITLPKTLDNYDFSARTGINAKQIKRLSEGHFIRESANIVFYGTFGVGKTHLALSLIQLLCEKGFRCYFSSTHALIDSLLKQSEILNLAYY
jgi:DNA replication protein DnaC